MNCPNCKIKKVRRDKKYCSKRCYGLSMLGHPNRNTGRTHFKKGFTPWNKGKKATEELRKKLGEAHKGIPLPNQRGKKHWNWKGGKPKCTDCGAIIQKNTTRCRLCHNKFSIGENSNNWRGGVYPKNLALRKSHEYKLWREAVFKRDSHTCIWCGDNRGGNLNADHIKPFNLFPELRFAIDNGRTLCADCHRKTDTYGSKSRKNK